MNMLIIAAWCVGVVLVVALWRVVNWVWLRPKKLEKLLREQGVKGNSYRFLHGDFKEVKEMMTEANSKPISLDGDVVSRVLPFHSKLVEKYGKNTFVWLGPAPAVLIMDPELIREIFAKNYQFHKLSINPLLKYLSTGVVSLEDDEWAKHRKIINPAFHLEKLKHMLPAFYTSCSEMLSKWEGIASPSGTCELDVWPYLQMMTSDVISRTAFGSSYEEGRRIFELQREQAQLIFWSLRSTYIPGKRFLPTVTNRRIKGIANEVNRLIRDIINKKVNAVKAGEGTSDDLLGILLKSNFKEAEEHDNINSGMSIEEVIGECELFYFAGQETTSSWLLWTMVLLSKHHEWQERARQEVLQSFGHETPSYDELNHLKTVTMILYEVLRMYPPIGTMSRRCTTELKLGKLTLPAGVSVQIPAILLHNDKEVWGEDAKEFKPERFSEGVSKATKGKVTYFPFGWGPRICIGQNFALLEAKLALAMILQRFSFELSPSYAHAPYALGILQPQFGAHLVLHKL